MGYIFINAINADMKVKELIKYLKDFNKEAEIKLVNELGRPSELSETCFGWDSDGDCVESKINDAENKHKTKNVYFDYI